MDIKLLEVDTLESALEKLHKNYLSAHEGKGLNSQRVEKLPLSECYNKVLAEDIMSPENIPAFNRSTVDGYALCVKDTQGASESLPVFLDIVGEVKMGEVPDFTINPGQCAYVPTGGALPDGADGVAMVEHCQLFGPAQVAVYSSLSFGHNMVLQGDDVSRGQTILKKGRIIEPADMGLLASIGKTEILTYKPWKISIISTGDEIVNPSCTPNPGQMRDVNTYGLIGEIKRLGFDVAGCRLVRDDYKMLKDAAIEAGKVSDVVLISGGSSKGKKDITEEVLDDITSGGVFVHGLAVKPGKPTILATDEQGRIFIGLPGHPVAALLIFRLLIGGLWEMEIGGSKGLGAMPHKAKMAVNIAASPGRKTFQLVTLEKGLAVPVLGKSGLIATMSKAHGYIVMDVNQEGINRGEEVEVWPL